MFEIYNANGQVIHRSRNLRGIPDHARRTWIEEAAARPAQEGKGALCVTFADNSQCRVEFASFTVLCWWLRARRSWAGARRINGSVLF